MARTGKTQKTSKPPTRTDSGVRTLIIIRHAHRDTTVRSADNGLSEKGRKQAAMIAKHWTRTLDGRKALILSSPKRRCVETVLPLARLANADVEVTPAVVEQSETETMRKLQQRVADFADWWKREAPELTVVCSHGDWIPLCVELLTGASASFSKGSWCEIERSGGRPELRWLIQSFAFKKP